MTYILSFLFTVFIVFTFYLFGRIANIYIFSSENSIEHNIVFGYILVFFIGFLVGVPAMVFGFSWRLYYISYLLIFATIYIIIIFITITKNKIKINGEIIRRFFKNHWFIILLSVIFTALSVTNLMPYVKNNYTDDAYIVRMVHLIDASNINNMKFGNGIILKHINNAISIQGFRIFNTYDLTYSFFSYLFKINLPFFCRITMTLINYFILFCCYQMFSQIWLTDDISQYSLIFFPLLMISAGYMAKGEILVHVRMFENWRIQTAIYMGGSIVRLLSFPLLLYMLHQIVYNIQNSEKHVISDIFQYIVICLSLISFQTTAISYIAVTIPIYLVDIIFTKLQNDRKIIKYIFTALSYIVLILLINYIFIHLKYENFIKFSKKISAGYEIKTLKDSVKMYYSYYRNVVKFDVIARYSLIPIVLLFLFDKVENNKMLIILVCLLYLTFLSNFTPYYLNMIGMLFFGTARVFSGLLVFILLIDGISVITLINHFITNEKYYSYKILNRNIVNSFLCLLSIFLALSTIHRNIDKIVNFNVPGDGIISSGYSMEPLINNDRMMPNMFVNVSKYFEKKPMGYYPVVSEDNLKWKGETYTSQSLLMCSNRVIIYDLNKKIGNVNYNYNFNMWIIRSYLSRSKENVQNYYSFNKHMKYMNIDYVFTTRLDVAEELEHNKYKCVVGGNIDKYWLLYKNN